MKQFILSQLARLGVVVSAVSKEAAKKQEAEKAAAAKPPVTPRPAYGLLKAAAKACKGELLSVTDAPVVQPASQPITPTMQKAPARTMADAFDKKAPDSFLMRKFASIPDVIAYNPKWENDAKTGYFDNLVLDPAVIQKVLPGELAKCCDDNGRQMIIIGTQLGPVVVFQRYTDGTDTVVFNARTVFMHTGLIRAGTTRLSESEQEAILGSIDDPSQPNISDRVDAIVNEVVPEAQAAEQD